MTHEFVHIVNAARSNQEKGIACVLATVVDLVGSSYRKPGVRMLLAENGDMIGAVSGGCVEKEVFRRAHSVFKTGKAKVITYDGRYRLGCEGILYILLEPFFVTENFYSEFTRNLAQRASFQMQSFYLKEDEATGNLGSVVLFNLNDVYSFSDEFKINEEENDMFIQVFEPCYRLLLIGGEHDAVKLCSMASLLGWQVTVVTSIKDPKKLSDFPGAASVIAETPETVDLGHLDSQTAVVLMNHNYVQDLKYLLRLKECQLNYIGLLGSFKRWERIQDELFNYAPDISEIFLDSVHSPAGLNIGAVTPEEIALSILSEILTVTREKSPHSLKLKPGKINS